MATGKYYHYNLTRDDVENFDPRVLTSHAKQRVAIIVVCPFKAVELGTIWSYLFRFR